MENSAASPYQLSFASPEQSANLLPFLSTGVFSAVGGGLLFQVMLQPSADEFPLDSAQ